MDLTSKEAWVAVNGSRVDEVTTAQGKAYVRDMTAADYERYQQALIDAKTKDGNVSIVGLRARLLSMTVCDASGTLLLSEADATALCSKASKTFLEPVVDAAMKLNGLGVEEKPEKN